MIYRIAAKCGDSYAKEKRGYLASSRIRIHWLSKYWDELDDCFYPEEFNQTSEKFFRVENQLKILKDYDVVIFNKTYEWRLAKELTERGQKVIVDMCDPDHLLSHSSKQRINDCLETFKYCAAIVVNGYEMRESVGGVAKKPIYIVPDRLDLEWHEPRKTIHNIEMKRLVWYGYNENLRVLEPYLYDILSQGYDLTVLSDKFFSSLVLPGGWGKQITFKVWDPESANRIIRQHDCVFVGRDPDEYLRQFKSNNRAITSWALGLPVAYDTKDLENLKSKTAREINVNQGWYEVRRNYDIRHSAGEYDRIVKEILK